MLPKQEPSKAQPAAADEDTDLPADLQRELLQLRARGGSVSLYEVLGLDATAEALAIRAAYIDRSKRWHPDAHYRRKLGSFGPLLSEAFRRVSEAHAVLADAEQRAGYDATLAARFSHKEAGAVALRTEARADEERRAEEHRRRLFHTKGFARIGAARRLYEEALECAERGERSLAVQALKTARELDPARKEIQEKLATLERELVKSRVTSAIVHARQLEEAGDREPAEVLKAWQLAVRHDPASVTAHLGAARAALRANDAPLAATFASRAVEYAPRAAEGRLLLARAFAAQGNKAKAKATLQAVLDEYPDQKEARAILKAI